LKKKKKKKWVTIIPTFSISMRVCVRVIVCT